MSTPRERSSGLIPIPTTCLVPILHTSRPGVTRLSLPYFMSDETVDYIITAVAMTARHGWKLLPQVTYQCNAVHFWRAGAIDYVYTCMYIQYIMFSHKRTQYRLNPETGMFCHHGDHPSHQRQWLSSISYESGVMTFPISPSPTSPSLQVITPSLPHCTVCVCTGGNRRCRESLLRSCLIQSQSFLGHTPSLVAVVGGAWLPWRQFPLSGASG